MISIIICSVDEKRFKAVALNYSRLLKSEPHEILRIGDARSLAEGYNRGIEHARGELLVFSHDDIEIFSPDLGPRIREYLGKFDLVGVAGTSRLISSKWDAAGPPYIFGQVTQFHPKGGLLVCFFGTPPNKSGTIQAMDGLFFAARCAVVEKVIFDAETFDGFHLYDLDFTFAAHLAGFRLGICPDIHILHASLGTQDEIWKQYADRFEQKYQGKLHPMIARPGLAAWAWVKTRQEAAQAMRDASPG